jgi:hypothetical protein
MTPRTGNVNEDFLAGQLEAKNLFLWDIKLVAHLANMICQDRQIIQSGWDTGRITAPFRQLDYW